MHDRSICAAPLYLSIVSSIFKAKQIAMYFTLQPYHVTMFNDAQHRQHTIIISLYPLCAARKNSMTP